MSKIENSQLKNLIIASLESRMAAAMQKFIENYEAKALMAPSMKEVRLASNEHLFQFFEQIRSKQFDYFILMTGIGLRSLLELWQERYQKEEIVETLKNVKLLVRGYKTRGVCNIWKIDIDHLVPEPNTWHEIIDFLKDHQALENKKIALLEYGAPNLLLNETLESRGAKLFPIQVYKWDMPDDIRPLKTLIQNILDEKVDYLLFTSRPQADHLLKVVQEMNCELAFRRSLNTVGIISIGPACSDKLRELQFFADFEVPQPHKMDNMLATLNECGKSIVEKKRSRTLASRILIQDNQFSEEEVKNQLHDSLFMRACRKEKNDRPPLWLMRQAGRYMAEYQISRRGMNFLEFCKDSDLAAEATLTAVERLGVDAAIIFSDILPIVEPMGIQLEYKEGAGPLLSPCIRQHEDIENLSPVDVQESMAFVLEAIKKVRKNLHPRIPLIGFCGAPFTMASYMIEGKGSRNYIPTKSIMMGHPESWHLLMKKLTSALGDLLEAQVNAGCQAVQIFDSWVGTLNPDQYREFVFPYSKALTDRISVPVIQFGTGASNLLPLMKETGCDVLGLDWRQDLNHLPSFLDDVALQGNLDPVLLFSQPKDFIPSVDKILDKLGNRPGFIFNLGHGILPETPVDHVMALVDYVKTWKTKP